MHVSYKPTDWLTLDEDVPNEVVGGVALGALAVAVILFLAGYGWVQSVLDPSPEPDVRVITSETLPPKVAEELDRLARQAPQLGPHPLQPVTTAPPVGSGRG